MKPSDLGESDDLGLRREPALGGPAHWQILQLGLDAVCIVVVDIFSEKSLQVVRIQDDHVIESFPACTPDPSLAVRDQ